MAAEVERLTVVINATAEGLTAAMEEAAQSLEGLEAAENKAAHTARQAGRGIGDAAKKAGHDVQQGTHQQARGHREAGKAARESEMTQTAALAAISAAAAKGFALVVQAVNTGIDAYNRYTAALQGLDSIASGKGIAGGAVEDALKGLADQFLDTAGAAAALKNLLSRGYSLEQAVNTITRLKDAAAFGRQASLSLKDAVVSATEGIKNENSVLVNARNVHLPSRTARTAA